MKANPARKVVKFGPAIVLSILVALRLVDVAVVRGKLQYRDPNGELSPAPGISITVSNAQGQRSGMTSSDDEGIYAITNVPPGAYRLEVWAKPGGEPATFEIQVDSLTTDLAPIRIP